MPSPSSSLATLRPDLAASFMEYDLANESDGHIAHRVMPVLDVQRESGTFGVIPVEQLLQTRDTSRAPGGGYSRSNYTFTKASYTTDEHGAEEPVDDREAKMYADYFDVELISAARAYGVVRRNAEQRVADALFNAVTFTPTAITHEWDDAANAVPITDVKSAKHRLWDASGIWANALICNQKVFDNICHTAELIDLIKYWGGDNPKAGDITPAIVARAMKLDFVFVGKGGKNTAAEGQNLSLSPIWSDEYAAVCRVAVTQDMHEPCIGRTFHYSEDGSLIGGTVETYREEQTRGDIVRVRHQTDEVMLYAAALELLSNVTT